ncbi:MAG: hypothetical protein ACO3UU_14160 [Minisyncoccia bacterium]
MALWGNNDNVGSGGTVSLSLVGSDWIVTGSGTTFGQVGAAATGDVIRFGIRGNGGTYYGDAVIVGIASTTQLTIGSTSGLSNASISGTSFYISELPLYTVGDYSYSNKLDTAPTIKSFGVTGTATTNSGIGSNYAYLVTSGKDIIVGDTILNDGNDIGIATVSADKVGLAVTISAGISTGDTLTFKRFTGGYDKQVYGISSTTAISYGSTSSVYRTSGAGWVGVTTYIDTHGNLRVKSEILVAGSGISTGSDGILYYTQQ